MNKADFDPNQLKLYLFYDGTPKVYTRRASATGMLSRHDDDGNAVFELNNGHWILLGRVVKAKVCERCGQESKQRKNAYGWSYHTEIERSSYEKRLPSWERTQLCYDCREEERMNPAIRRFGR